MVSEEVNGTNELVELSSSARGLDNKDTFGKSDPFVRVYLLPGVHDLIKTEVIKKNLNPVFNEMFKFPVSLELGLL